MNAMRPRLFIWIICILIPFKSHAQLQDSLDWMYEELPANLFPTGLLHDVSAVHLFTHSGPLDPHYHKGNIPGANANMERFQYVYMDLYHSQLRDSSSTFYPQNSLRLLPWDSLFLDEKYFGKVDVPLMLLWTTFNSLDSNAVAQGYLDFHNGQFKLIDEYINVDDKGQHTIYQGDPQKRSQKAVIQDTTFIGAALYSSVYSETATANVTYRLSQSEVYENIDGIDSVSVDFADGKGFSKINRNQTITVSYQCATSQVEHAVKQLRIRGYKNGKELESRLKVNIVFNVPAAQQELLTDLLPSPTCLPSRTPSQGARASVRYADPNKGLQRPVLIIEGFESSTQPYGNLTYESISSGYVFDENGERIFQHIHPLSWMYDSLSLAGYDIIHLDFREAKLSLKENEIHVLRTLRWINEENPLAEISLIGASMGGLIAKMAINDLVSAGCCYPIIGYGSFDVPHRGAFIPIGLQAASKYYAELLPWVPMARNPWTAVVNSAAARELLITHFDPTAIKVHEHLLKSVALMPEGMRRYAISNGSDMGISRVLTDPFSRYFTHGIKRPVCVRHAVGSHPDTISFNRNGYSDSLLIFGVEAVAHSHIGSYLFHATSYRQIVTALKMNWTAACSARKVQFIAAVGPFIPGLSKAFLSNVIIKRQKRTNISLANMKLQMTKGVSTVVKHKFPVNYAEVPGGWTGTAAAFDLPVLSNIYSSTHCFIPSFSALDVSDSLVSLPLRSESIASFHSFIAPGIAYDSAASNQAHIAVDSTIIAFGMAQLRSIYDQAIRDSIKTDFNIAQEQAYFGPVQSELGSLIVPKNVTLGLGLGGPSGATNSGVTSATHQEVHCFVGGGCTADTLHIYGTLHIGDGPHRQASIRVNDAGVLVLHKEARLFINDGSELEIGREGTLIIEKGVTIELDSGTIDTKGLLSLQQDALLQPKGFGKLIFSENAAVSAEKDALVHLEDLEIRVKSTVVYPSLLNEFRLNRCKVYLSSNATILSNCTTHLWNTEFIKTGKKQNAALTFSQGVVDIQHCIFQGGAPAITISDSVQWSMSNTTISNAHIGLYASAAPHLFSANTFMGNTTGGHITGDNYLLERSVFHSNDVGLIVRGRGKRAQIEACSFTSNSSVGLQSIQTKLHVFCSEFSYNTMGIQALKGELKLAKNTGNTFNNNTIGIRFQNLERLELQQGHNTFSQQVVFDLTGSFAPLASLSYNGSYHYIYANNTSFSKVNSNFLTVGKDTVYVLYSSSQPPSTLLCPSKGGKKKEGISWSRTEASPEFVVFPNPGSEWVELVFPQTISTAELTVFNAQGEQIFIEQLPPGTYRKQLNIKGNAGLHLIRLIDGKRINELRWLKLD